MVSVIKKSIESIGETKTLCQGITHKHEQIFKIKCRRMIRIGETK